MNSARLHRRWRASRRCELSGAKSSNTVDAVPTASKLGASMIKPFRINVSDDVLADLKARLQRTRWPDAELVTDWSQGAPLRWIQDICQYWANTYDWRAREAQLNRFDQFTSEIDGL